MDPNICKPLHFDIKPSPWEGLKECPTLKREEKPLTELERCQMIATNVYKKHKEDSTIVARKLERYMNDFGCKCKIHLTFKKPPCGKSTLMSGCVQVTAPISGMIPGKE
jgi:hypothetical protein